jgi:aliphatic sulfonates family ABC transporter substrate-binding protein
MSMAVLTLPNADALALSVRAKALVFEDPLSCLLLERIRRIAPSDATALIVGETGTGKEIVARHLHALSARHGRPFVAVNCGALSETLVDSELFGHERGAFTGAVAAKRGWFESAEGGTLFLDEIGDLPGATQVKLLRVLQEREVVRVGARTPIPIDVRLVAATNVDLEKAVRAGKFREDLYYRLNVAVLPLPPLRDRPGDVLPLVQHFLGVYGQRLGAGDVALDADAVARLVAHPWPGNIRELENVIHHALLVCRDGQITTEDLRLASAPSRLAVADVAPATLTPATPRPTATATATLTDPWRALEGNVQALLEAGGEDLHGRIDRLVLRTAFEHCERNQVQTAKRLGISRNVLRARLIDAGDLCPARSAPPALAMASAPASALASAPSPLTVRGNAGGSRLQVRIGYQQFGLLWILRASGTLDQALDHHGADLVWTEFASGSDLVDALRVGALDLGVAGEAPPLLAQAARAPIVYLAAEPPAPEAEAIVVAAGSPIGRVADLRGRRVAVTRGANVHFLLLRALEEAAVEPALVDVIFADPVEARRLFEGGAVSAWAIWDPHLASVQYETGARVLRDATGLTPNRAFYVGARDLIESRPDLVDLFLSEVARLGRSANDNPHAVVDLPGASTGIARPALLAALRRNRFGLQPFDAELTRSQQGVADLSVRANLIPHPISIADARWVRHSSPPPVPRRPDLGPAESALPAS